MRDEERAGHLHEWKTSEKTSLTNATMPRKLIGSVLVRWTVQRRIGFQREPQAMTKTESKMALHVNETLLDKVEFRKVIGNMPYLITQHQRWY